MRYMLLIYKDEKLWDEMSVAEKGAIFQRAVEFSDALRPSGVYQGASRWSRPAPPRPCACSTARRS